MSLTPAMLDALLASGCTAEQIVAVVKIDMGERQARLAKDAARKRAERAVSKDVHGHPGTSEASEDDPALSPAPLPSPQTPQPTPHPHTHPDNNTPCARDDPFPMPEWCPSRQIWVDLKANRKAKRLPCTPTAHAKLLRDIDRLADDDWPPGRLLEAIVARGWAAAYDPREPTNDNRQQRPPFASKSTRSAAETAIANLTGAGNR